MNFPCYCLNAPLGLHVSQVGKPCSKTRHSPRLSRHKVSQDAADHYNLQIDLFCV